jgi:hypothetical protein
VAEGFEPSMAALTVRCLTNLATPQEKFLVTKGTKARKLILCFCASLWLANLVAAGGVEPPT